MLSCLGGLLAAGILLWHGHWSAVWRGIMLFPLSPLVFPFLMIPAGFCGGVMTVLQDRAPRLRRALHVGSIAYLICMLSFWAAWSFGPAASLLAQGVLVPAAAAWSVAAAAAPWLVFARQDPDNLFFTALITALSLACAAAALAGPLPFGRRFLLIAAVMALLTLLQALYEEIFCVKPS